MQAFMKIMTRYFESDNNDDVGSSADIDRCGEGKCDAWKLLGLSPSLSSQNSAMLKYALTMIITIIL